MESHAGVRVENLASARRGAIQGPGAIRRSVGSDSARSRGAVAGENEGEGENGNDEPMHRSLLFVLGGEDRRTPSAMRPERSIERRF